jgi:hypothetical protein
MQGPTIKMPTAPEEELSIVDRINRLLAPPEATEEQKEFARNRRPRRSRGPYGMNMSGVGAADAKPVDYEEVGDLALQGVGLSSPKPKKDTSPSISQEQQDLAEANIRLNAQQGAQQVDDDQKTAQTAQQQADQYIADARKAREEGLITKEDLAKKEALGAALIQLGAGIAKGDFAEGLSKAGVAAQDVREKARDRAVRARYYDSLSESRTGATPQNLRRLQQAVSEQLKEEFPQGRLANEAAYLARQQELLQQLSKDYGIDISALAASPADPTVAAAQSATPATSRYVFD